MADDSKINLHNAPDWFREAHEQILRQQPAPQQPPHNAQPEPPIYLTQEEMLRSGRILELTREVNRGEEIKLKQEERRTEREKIKQRITTEQPRLADPNDIQMVFAMSGDTVDLKLEFLVEPYLPRASIVGFFGRGETAKSSFIATMAASISPWASTLWISCEEPKDWIKARHTTGIQITDDKGTATQYVGVDQSLLVVTAVASKQDAQGRVIASNFNIWEHLEPAIWKAKAGLQAAGRPELKLITLDTAVGLTAWSKGENSNDDAAVKKLLGYLMYLAEKHDVTIAFIGHANKGKHDYFADSVMGATAWVNTPRLSFMHAKHRNMDEGHCVIRVAKSNVIPHMAAVFSVHRVCELHTFEGGYKAGLQKVLSKPIVWGSTAAEELWEEATRKTDDNEVEFGETFGGRPSLVDTVIRTLVEMVMATPVDKYVTRGDVETKLGRPLHNREWQKVDKRLAGNPEVMIEQGSANLLLYRKRPTCNA